MNKQSTLQYIHSDDCLGFHLCLDGISFTRLISCETNIFHLGKCIWRWETHFPDHYKPFPDHYTPFPTMKLLDLPYPYKPFHYYENSWPTMLVYRTHDLILPNLFLLFCETFKSFCGYKKTCSFSSLYGNRKDFNALYQVVDILLSHYKARNHSIICSLTDFSFLVTWWLLFANRVSWREMIIIWQECCTMANLNIIG